MMSLTGRNQNPFSDSAAAAIMRATHAHTRMEVTILISASRTEKVPNTTLLTGINIISKFILQYVAAPNGLAV
jgi:hypothetical protein